MTWAIRGSVLTIGAAALLSTQAVYAAPASTRSTGVDPLVSLSVLGTSQSRGAVCSGATFGAGAACGIPAVATASAAAATAVAVQGQPKPKPVTPLIALGAIVIIAALIAAIVSGGGNGHGDLTPISPA